MSNIYTSVYRGKDVILCRERDEKKRSLIVERDFHPVVYTPNSIGKYTDHTGDVSLEPIQLDSNMYTAAQEIKDLGRNAFGTNKLHWQYIQKFYPEHKGFAEQRARLHVSYIDIEVYSPDEFPTPDKARHPVNAITIYSTHYDKYFVLHLYNSDWKSKSKIPEDELKKVKAKSFETEDDLLEAFLQLWESDYPDIVSGWNCDQFDMPYMFNRLRRVMGKDASMRLSPFGYVRNKTVRGRFGQDEKQIDISGIEIRDYLNLYIKYTFKKRESYKLDYIAYIELDEKKVEYDQDGLHNLADEDPDLFVDYNWKDVWLVKRLDEELGLMGLIIDLAYMTGINFEETDSPVKLWDSSITNYLAERDMHLPVDGLGNTKRGFFGAHVRDEQVGYHPWVVSFDLTSLYPSIIRQWNMGPDTMVPGDLDGIEIVQEIIEGEVNVDEGFCIAANGTTFRTDKTSFLNALMTEGFAKRKDAKRKMFEAGQRGDKAEEKYWYTNQLAMKVFLNSGYGAFANEYFRAFDVLIAEAITLTGQLVSKWLFDELNEYLSLICGSKKDRIVAGDTDSVYITLGDLVDRFLPDETDEDKIVDFLDKAANKIVSDCINPAYENLRKATNCKEQLMNMDREVIGTDSFWRTKKNYAIRIRDDEGKRLVDPKYKIMGLEPARSTYREPDRKKMEDAIHLILDRTRGAKNGHLFDLINDYKKEYVEKPLSEIGYAVRANKIHKWQDGEGVRSGCPGHVRAAINYNNMIKKHDLGKRFEMIAEGDSIFVLALKTPNPTPFNKIAHKGVLPNEFGLTSYIDFDTMFDRNFLKPVKSYATAVGWKSEDTPDLLDFLV